MFVCKLVSLVDRLLVPRCCPVARRLLVPRCCPVLQRRWTTSSPPRE